MGCAALGSFSPVLMKECRDTKVAREVDMVSTKSVRETETAGQGQGRRASRPVNGDQSEGQASPLRGGPVVGGLGRSGIRSYQGGTEVTSSPT